MSSPGQEQEIAVDQQASDVPAPGIYAVEETLSTLAQVPRLPSWARSRNVREQFQYAFELIGGIPRLAHWAHANPTDFFKLYARMIPTQVSGEGGGPIKVQLSWVNGRDTSGKTLSAGQVIDVTPTPNQE